MRIAILWTALSGYLNACLRELAGRPDVQLMVSHQVTGNDAPFAESHFNWIENRLVWKNPEDLSDLIRMLDAFHPDIVVFSGWHIPAYRRAARSFRGKAWRVMTMDNCWLGTLKQRMAVVAAPIFPRPLADAVWLCGERQAVFARKLGFEQSAILTGVYSCDNGAFNTVREERHAQGRKLDKNFLFIGRLVPVKGIKVLAEAYSAYRSRVPSPWPLICCGTGPMQNLMEGRPGVVLKGFVQPSQLPAVMASAGCLVLPSEFEPWAVVVHEATAAGIPVLASNRVGSAIHLVQPGLNGYLFDCHDARGLARLMQRMTEISEHQREQMSEGSYLLSHQYSPARWADTLLEGHWMAQSAIRSN